MPTTEHQTEMRIVAEITAKPGHADALRKALLAMIPASTAEAGCRQYELHEDREDENRFIFVERWTDAAAFEFHTNTIHFKQLGPSIDKLLAKPAKLSKLKVIG